MEIIFFLLPLSLLLALTALGAYAWAVRTGQFEDLETPRWRVLLDESGPDAPAGSAGEEERRHD